CTTNSWNTDYW
nr:immunoglobulin heavy chain junction region [Macaca mulatta]MOW45442.1 immunoglobulin heavy chain junction region [Macaca mulatta]MOW45482.1 immunoglobulin heavy chain junction region [Macaca mulatta]MOW45492.1 immunoglobulin heavy chain junction region [Macaca mulatta]MOW45501.1 immunoglobulin heavy chain junction region [Macaca mulatta]